MVNFRRKEHVNAWKVFVTFLGLHEKSFAKPDEIQLTDSSINLVAYVLVRAIRNFFVFVGA